MSEFRPRVISLNKKKGQTFGFYLRVEHGEDGHLIRCLELGGPAELAGIKDGDRILRVNGTFVDELTHAQVVDMVTSSGTSVTFHILDEESYKQAKAKGVDLADPPIAKAEKTEAQRSPKAKLCYLVRSTSGFGFSLSSFVNEPGMFCKLVTPGGVAQNAGVTVNDRVVEINGDNIEGLSHKQVVEKITKAGNSLMLLLVDKETDEYYKSKSKKIATWMATVKHLPHKPRIADVRKGPQGFGFTLNYEHNTGHFFKEVEKKSPAERAGMKTLDRLVAVDGQDVESWSHEQVVDAIRKSGNTCSLLVVDQFTDQMYKLGKVSPLLYQDTSPPSYSEALYLPPRAKQSTSESQRREKLEPKLCRMKKSSGTFGFHLNGIQGINGHFISEVVKGGAADKAGMEDNDILLEVNGVNVEKSSHDEVVEMIRRSGNTLEMLVAEKSLYDLLKSKEANIKKLSLEETPKVEVQKESPRDKKHEDPRPETPPGPVRDRSSSSSSEDSLDEKL